MTQGISTETSRPTSPTEPIRSARRAWDWARLRSAAWLVAVPVFLLYGVWFLAFYGPGHDPRDAVLIGRHFVQQSDRSAVIKLDPSYRYPAGDIGYDGEFVYFIALDPLNARYYTDAPSYRYTRIVLPLAARGLALGQARLIPYTLLLINWLAIGGGTLFAALWLRRRGVSPWFALAYGLYPGLFIAFQRDTTEALAYGLVALAVLVWDVGGRYRLLLAAGVFALAVLTRETTAVFPLIYGLGVLLGWSSGGESANDRRRSRWCDAALLVGVALLPLLLYKAFLLVWLGSQGDPGLLLERVPFLGILKTQQSQGWVEEIRTVVTPGLICLGTALLVLRRRLRLPEAWILVANAILFVVLLHRSSMEDISASGRVTAGVVLAAVLCLPSFSRVLLTRSWFWVSSTLWLSLVPFWVVIPEIRYLIDVSRPLRHSL